MLSNWLQLTRTDEQLHSVTQLHRLAFVNAGLRSVHVTLGTDSELPERGFVGPSVCDHTFNTVHYVNMPR